MFKIKCLNTKLSYKTPTTVKSLSAQRPTKRNFQILIHRVRFEVQRDDLAVISPVFHYRSRQSPTKQTFISRTCEGASIFKLHTPHPGQRN